MAPMRRRQWAGGLRWLHYAAPGGPRLLARGAKGHDELIDVAESVRSAPIWPNVVPAHEAGRVLIETPFAS